MENKPPNHQSFTQHDMEVALAASKSYYGPALISLALYWILFWIGGLIANIVYLNSAYNAKKVSGKSPEGLGCLWILILVHVVLPLVAGVCFLVFGGLLSVSI